MLAIVIDFIENRIYNYINEYTKHQYSDEVFMIILYTYIHLLQILVPSYHDIPPLLSFIEQEGQYIYLNENQMETNEQNEQNNIQIIDTEKSSIPIINIKNYSMFYLSPEELCIESPSQQLYHSSVFHKYISILLSILLNISHSKSVSLSLYSFYAIDMMILIGDQSFIDVIYPLTLSTFGLYMTKDITYFTKQRILSMMVYYHLFYKKMTTHQHLYQHIEWLKNQETSIWMKYMKKDKQEEAKEIKPQTEEEKKEYDGINDALLDLFS